MKVRRNVEVPTVYGRRMVRSPHIEELLKFLETDETGICFECEDNDEARTIASSVCAFIKKHDLPCKSFKRGNDIYVKKNEKWEG